MKMTVEIDDDQRAELLELATLRGDTDIASIVREALDAYLVERPAKRFLIAQALSVRGSFSDVEADELAASIGRLRQQ